MAALVATAMLRRVELPAIEYELVASDKAFDVRMVRWLRRLWCDGAAGEVDRVEGFLDVERTRFAVAVDAVPIEEAERGVAGLLDFGDHESVAQGVDRAGFEEDAIADARFKLVEAGVAVAGGEGAFELSAVNARFEAGVDFAAGFGSEDDPGFGLAEVGRSEFRALGVVRMDLNGERELRIQEFEQERELRLRMVAAEERWAVIGDQFVQRAAGERAVGDDTLIRAVVDDFPALGVAVAVADGLAEHSAQAAAAPDVFLEKWLKA